jgi:hypothetical protein
MSDVFTAAESRVVVLKNGGVQLRASILGRPLSTNHMYTINNWGRLSLKQTGRKFQDTVVTALAELCSTRDWGRRSTDIYIQGGWAALRVKLLFPSQRNGAWVKGSTKTTEKGNLRSPYKKLDASNYYKCIEDGVVRATGVDDSLTVRQSISKDFNWKGPSMVLIRYTVWLPQS